MMIDPLVLLQQLSEATAGQHTFDEAIWLALDHSIKPVKEVGRHTYHRWIHSNGSRWSVAECDFTVSLDAALRLVPVGYKWSGGGNPGHFKFAVQEIAVTRDKIAFVAQGKTAPLALCGAVLRAQLKIRS